MANVIQIKRGSGTPSSLADGELGFDKTNNILYIGNGSSVVAFNYVKKTGDTMTGNLSIHPTGTGVARVYDGTNGGSLSITFSNSNHQTHGLYSYGYAPSSDTWTADGAWMVYRNASGNIILNGNATTATTATTVTYPLGFSNRSTNATWGDQTGATITSWNEADGGSIDFRKNNPSSGKLSIKVDGRFYFNEGATPAGGLKSANGYWGMTDPDGSDSVWIRTTSNGLLPYQSGGVASGHQSLGTSTWYFNHAYVSSVHGGSGEFTNGNVAITAGNLWAGTDGNTASERQVGVQSGSGRIYLFSQASTGGERGIYLSAHGTDTSGKYVFRVNLNNVITYTGGYVAGNLEVNTGNVYAGASSDTTEHWVEARCNGNRIIIDATSTQRGIWADGAGWIFYAAKGTNVFNIKGNIDQIVFSTSQPSSPRSGLIWVKPL